jgi:hypothetical protein
MGDKLYNTQIMSIFMMSFLYIFMLFHGNTEIMGYRNNQGDLTKAVENIGAQRQVISCWSRDAIEYSGVVGLK